MSHQACKPQDLQLQIAVCHLYAPRSDGHPGIQVATEVYYPENVDGYFCEGCGQLFGIERAPDAAATEERVQQAWQRALHHLHAAVYKDRGTGEAVPPKELAETTSALLTSLPAAGAKGGAL